jgi:hypothetical protein
MLQGNDNLKPDEQSFFKKWLEKLQQDSWQLELVYFRICAIRHCKCKVSYCRF